MQIVAAVRDAAVVMRGPADAGPHDGQ
jgi:hypothetical protein